MSSIRISKVSFEHHHNGFGIGHAAPRVSWRFASSGIDLKEWLQTSYEVEVGRPGSSTGHLYHVQSSDSVLVPWPGSALQSRESVWVKVKAHGTATDSNNASVSASTDWSERTALEVALLEPGDWKANLTTSALQASSNGPIRPLLFRKRFKLPAELSKVSKGRLYITAHGLYKVYLNGQRVGTDEMAPGWTSYHHRLNYQTLSVATLLPSSLVNVIAVEVAEGWYAGRLGWDGRRFHYGNQLGFRAQLEIYSETGSLFTLVSDSTWKCSHGAITRSEIYDGEDYDSRLEQKGWTSDPNFDDSMWPNTEEISLPCSNLVASDSPPVRVTEELSPVIISRSKSGKVLIDFGQNLTGKLRVRLPVVDDMDLLDGQKLMFSHAEVLENGDICTRPLRKAKPVDSVILSRSQPEKWTPQFTFHGFRYVQVDGWPVGFGSGLPTKDDVTALVLHSDMRRTGWFACSDSLLNQLHQNTLWGMRGNFLSVPTDCPQRDERLGWTGDIHIFMPSASFLYDVGGFMRSWLADLAAEQNEEGRMGVPPVVVPDVLGLPPPHDPPHEPSCAWHDVAVLAPWDMYTSSGDRDILRLQYASMKAWIDRGLPRGPNGLWDQNVWQFGDWLDPTAPPDEPGKAATDCTMVADAYLYHVLNTISKISSLIGEVDDAARYSRQAAEVKAAFQFEYVTPAGLLACDTQTAHATALCFGLFENGKQVSRSMDRLDHLVHSEGYRISTGFVGTPLITHALSDNGNYQLAYRMLLEKKCPSWLYPITMGATTIWERWDSMLPDGSINPGEMTSFNHYALGSVVNWMHKNIGGISPLEPGWRKVKVRPVPGGTVTSAELKYDGPYGRIECTWTLDKNDTFSLSVTIPPNSTAVVILPSQWNKAAQHQERGVEIGSGVYDFSCSFTQDEWPPKAKLRRSTFRLQHGTTDT